VIVLDWELSAGQPISLTSQERYGREKQKPNREPNLACTLIWLAGHEMLTPSQLLARLVMPVVRLEKRWHFN